MAFAHIKQDRLDAKVVKCVFVDYPEGIEGYKLWKMDPRGSKFIISNDATFYKTCMGMKCKDPEVKESESMVKKTRFKMEVHTSETRN